MYINFELLDKNYNLFFILVAAKQKKTLILQELTDEDGCNVLIEKGLLKLIKGKKKDTFFEKVRIDKKGTAFLEEIETPEVTEVDIKMFEYLCDMYLTNEDEERKVGNKKKTKMYIAIFRHHCGINVHQMFWLCKFFLEEYKYTKILEYIFFNSNKNRYGTFKANVEDSPLFQFYDERKAEVEKLWSTKKDC